MPSKRELFDVGIVGFGPAAITAAIYAARKKLRVVLIGKVPGGEIVTSGDIENWPGGGATDGITLAEQFVKHVRAHTDSVTIVEDAVARVKREPPGTFQLSVGDNMEYRTRTVVFAAGRHPRKLGVPGEKEYKNRGVSYCATCDAPLFTEKVVAVIGGGNTGAEAVIMLQKIARKIYLLHIDDTLRADPVLVDNFKNDPKVEILYKAKTSKVEGSALVERLTYQDTMSGAEKTLAVDGLFVAIGSIPNTEPVKDLIPLDQYGAVPADRYGVTNVPGFFAAGDVTDIRDAQIVVAAGHGCSAALSAGDYLSRN